MGNTAMRKSGQSLIVETGIFEWPWHTPFGLAIIAGACGGGGGGGGEGYENCEPGTGGSNGFV